MFLHSAFVGPSKGTNTAVRRHVKGQKQRVHLSAPIVQREYAKHFNAVDRNDRDSSDYTCSIRTARWYLRIFFWLLDRVVLSLFIIVCFLAQHNIGDNMWKRYSNRNKGRRKFQIALALELMIYAIELDWKDGYNENEKPRWMRQSSYIPCGCKRCFFCINRKTSGVHHDKSTIVMTSPGSGKKRKRGVRCTYHRFPLARLKGRGSYCRQCYRKMKGKNKRSKCKHSRMGCPACDEPICTDCWKNGYDNVLHKP